MRRPMRSLRVLLLAWLLAGSLISAPATLAAAEPTATPDGGAEPTATPTAAELAAMREGRLGGTLDEVQEQWGEPDTDRTADDGTKFITYNEPEIDGETLLYLTFIYDDEETITEIRLFWETEPEYWSDRKRLGEFAAEVAPEDGICNKKPVKNDLGTEVYPCTSAALKPVFTPAEIKALGRKGAPGVYNWRVQNEDATLAAGVFVSFGRNLAKASGGGQAKASPEELQARIGGTRAEFEAEWGEPQDDNGAVKLNGKRGYTYTDAPIGLFIVAAYDGTGPNAILTDVQVPIMGVPDDASEAATWLGVVMVNFAPDDFACDSDSSWQGENEMGYPALYFPCTSPTLTDARGIDDFTVEFVLLTDGTIISLLT